MIRVPPHYFWPGLVIAFLSLTVVFNVVIFKVANSGNGAQPVENYYGKAVNFDDLKAREQAARALGFDWQPRFVAAADSGRRLELIVRDAEDRPVEGIEATVELRRPSLARPVAEGELEATSGKPGHYKLADAVARPGLWDVVVDGTFEECAFQKTMRIEWDARDRDTLEGLTR